MPRIIIANSLHDGFVVFLTADHHWSGAIADAAVADDEATAAALLDTARRAEAANQVVDPYLIEVDKGGDLPRPVEYREYIRAFGPSVAIPSAG